MTDREGNLPHVSSFQRARMSKGFKARSRSAMSAEAGDSIHLAVIGGVMLWAMCFAEDVLPQIPRPLTYAHDAATPPTRPHVPSNVVSPPCYALPIADCTVSVSTLVSESDRKRPADIVDVLDFIGDIQTFKKRSRTAVSCSQSNDSNVGSSSMSHTSASSCVVSSPNSTPSDCSDDAVLFLASLSALRATRR